MNEEPLSESSLWPLVTKAYHDARLSKRGTKDEQRFERRSSIYMAHLIEEIENRTYRPSRGIAFITRNPVIREIFAAPFRDRIVHHLLFNFSGDWWDRRFINDSYSCRKGKGTLYGVKRLYHHIASASDNFTKPAYVLKLDVEGYFMSLSRKKLYEVILWGLDRQFSKDSWEYKTCKFLWRKIIFDNPTGGVKMKGSILDWDDLPRSKSLFCSQEGIGIVIGNLTSQLLSNIYLDKLDRYVTLELGFKYYGRYVDDFYLVSKDKGELKRAIPTIKAFLETIELKLHPNKIFLQDCSKGMPFLGAIVYPYRIQPGGRLVRNFKQAAREYINAGGELDSKSEEAVSITSYKGHLKHYKHRKLVCNVLCEAYPRT
jgi:hypothetical protein